MSSSSSVTVSLRVLGDTLEPEEVSAILGGRPSASYRKGDAIGGNPSGTVAPTGGWVLNSTLSPQSELEEHVEFILGQLTGDPDEWASLTSRFAADISCGVAMPGDSERVEISPRLSQALAERGLVIGLDIDTGDRG